jgi:L-asparagine permease
VFSRLGIPGIGDVMNAVVLTAALSSVNSGPSSTGWILRSPAGKGEAPSSVGRMSSRRVPHGGILPTSIAYLLGAVLNYLVPKETFAIAVASLGVITAWARRIFGQLHPRQAALRGELQRPSYTCRRSPTAAGRRVERDDLAGDELAVPSLWQLHGTADRPTRIRATRFRSTDMW